MSKHTPAPWTICEHSWSDTGIYNSDDTMRIASLSIYSEATEETQDELAEEMKANAKIIASAPDLLEALIQIKSMCDGNDTTQNNIWHKANAAIQKATT